MNRFLFALPKGRLGEDALARLVGTDLEPIGEPSRALCIPTRATDVDLVWLKGADLVSYVSRGVAALGIVGSDSLDESPDDTLELLDLRFGACRLSLCAVDGVTLEGLRRKHHLRIATKFVRQTSAWLAREGLSAELVPLSSSIELAPLLGLSDAIVDLVQTGRTLTDNGLTELQVLTRTSARLVASRGLYATSETRIRQLCAIVRARFLE